MQRSQTEWIVSRPPAPYRFAFTIVHDADSAYSARLEPLLDAFDALGLRVTLSAFAFWADWAHEGRIWSQWRTASPFNAPVAVPICDADEQRFYQRAVARGHEVALHSPSDTSSPREQVIAAFELFDRVFGSYPAVYVEHSSSTNKDALSNEGANPESPYYCEDVLRQYGPWVWVDGIGALRNESDGKFFEIPPSATFLNHHAAERYQLDKAFVRTGRWRMGGGDGFLATYTEENVDCLDRDGGIALVYTHLDDGWLDPRTRQLRADIRERLEYIASKNGWFAPASHILDRARLADTIGVARDGADIVLTNAAAVPLSDVVLRAPADNREMRAADLLPGTGQRLRSVS